MNIEQVTWDGEAAVEIITSQVRMVIVTGMGPRIAFWGRPGGRNMLSWFSGEIGRGDWRLMGGHRVWITRPGADESEDSYAADNLPCIVEQEGEELVVTGGEHPFLKVSRGLRIRQLDEDTFRVVSFLTNTGSLLYSGGVWAVTCTNPGEGTSYAIPLGDRSKAWDLIKVVIPRQFGGNICPVDDPQFEWTDDLLIIHPQGNQGKRMLYAPKGVIFMTNPVEGITFIKRSEYLPGLQYPLGCNLAVFIGNGNFTVELESYGAEQTVQPGETLVNVETWKLVGKHMDWQEDNFIEGTLSQMMSGI